MLNINTTACVVIPYYNGEPFIKRCLDSIAASANPVTKVFLIDNSTTTRNLSSLLKDYSFVVEIINTDARIGFGRACNIGLWSAHKENFDIAIVLNQDAVVDKHCLERLVEPIREDKEIVIAVPLSLDVNLNNIVPKTLRKYLYPIKGLVNDYMTGQAKPYYPIDSEVQANGACMAIALEKLVQIGMFDPVFHMYGEDTDLLARVLYKHNKKVVLVPEARIGHVHSNFSSEGEKRKKIEALTRHAGQICHIKDPRYSLSWGLFLALKKNIHSYLLALVRLDFRLVGLYLRKDLELIRLMMNIIRNRDDSYLKTHISRCIKEDIRV